MIDLTTLVENTDRYSGSDLRSLCVDACSHMVYDAVSKKEKTIRLRMEHFEEAVKGRKPVMPPSPPDLSGMTPEKLQLALQMAAMLMGSKM